MCCIFLGKIFGVEIFYCIFHFKIIFSDLPRDVTQARAHHAALICSKKDCK